MEDGSVIQEGRRDKHLYVEILRHEQVHHSEHSQRVARNPTTTQHEMLCPKTLLFETSVNLSTVAGDVLAVAQPTVGHDVARVHNCNSLYSRL